MDGRRARSEHRGGAVLPAPATFLGQARRPRPSLRGADRRPHPPRAAGEAKPPRCVLPRPRRRRHGRPRGRVRRQRDGDQPARRNPPPATPAPRPGTRRGGRWRASCRRAGASGPNLEGLGRRDRGARTGQDHRDPARASPGRARRRLRLPRGRRPTHRDLLRRPSPTLRWSLEAPVGSHLGKSRCGPVLSAGAASGGRGTTSMNSGCCRQCDGSFDPSSRADRRTCSSRCHVAAWRARQRAEGSPLVRDGTPGGTDPSTALAAVTSAADPRAEFVA